MAMPVYLIGLPFLGIGGNFLLKGYKEMKKKHVIEAMQTSKIKLIKEGSAEINGSVLKKDKLLKAPFSGDECVWCKYYIEKPAQHDDDTGAITWKDVAVDTISSSFVLEDDTGKTEINPEGAVMEISTKYEFFSGNKKEPTEAMLKILKEKGIDHKGLLGSKHFRYREQLIIPKDKLYVFGNVERNPVQESSRYMIKKGKDMFYITDKDEKQILVALNQRMIGMFIGGGILFLIGMFFFMTLF